jgi:hypothetical protein
MERRNLMKLMSSAGRRSIDLVYPQAGQSDLAATVPLKGKVGLFGNDKVTKYLNRPVL